MPGGLIDDDPANGVLVAQVRPFGTLPAEIPSAAAPLISDGRRASCPFQPEARRRMWVRTRPGPRREGKGPPVEIIGMKRLDVP